MPHDQPVAEGEERGHAVDDRAPGAREGVARGPAGAPALGIGRGLLQGHPQVPGAPQEHAPHVSRFPALQLRENRIGKEHVRVVAARHGFRVPAGKSRVELPDQRFMSVHGWN